MTDAEFALVAFTVWAGAFTVDARLAPAAAVAALVLGADRRTVVVVLVAGVLAVGLAHRAHAALDPVEAGPFEADGTIRRDPERFGASVRFDLDVGGRRYEVWVWGGGAAGVAHALVGERVTVEGTVRPRPDDHPWRRQRGVVGVVSAERVEVTGPGSWWFGLANTYRRTVEAGAAALGDGHRALFTGLVYGDDREQSIQTADDFRRAGLGHLLAVSGQNVAFVLMVVWPLVALVGIRARAVVIGLVLAAFATVTRFEPSVARATVMAGGAAVAAGAGRVASSVRLLALAVTVVVLFDPLMARSVGFQLSVLATLGIVVGSGPLATRVPGPRVVGLPVAVTVAAQVAVAPVLAVTFGSVPLVALPANLAAGPAAGPVMAWGMTGGWLAGALGPPFDRWLHLPTRLGVAWIGGVARVAADLPVGTLGPTAVAVVGTLTSLAVLSRGRLRMGAGALAVLVLGWSALPPGLDPGRHRLADGVVAWRDHHGVVVVELGDVATPAEPLEVLRAAGIRHVALVVLADRGPVALEALRAVRARLEVGSTWIGPGSPVRGATVPAEGRHLLGAWLLDVDLGDGLAVTISPA